MKKLLLKLLLACAILLSATCAVSAITIPDPSSDDSFVEDYASVLSDETESYVTQLNQSLVNDYSGCVVVVTVNYYDGDSISDYALELFNEWQIGSSETNDGILFLLAIENDDYYVMWGYGLDDSFSTATLDDIIDDDIEPYFAQKDYDSAVKYGVKALYDELVEINQGTNNANGNSSDIDIDPQPHSSGFHIGNIIFTIIAVIIIFGLVISIILRPRRYYGGGYYRPHGFFHSRPRGPRPGGFGGGPSSPNHYSSGPSHSTTSRSHSSSSSSHSSHSVSHSSSRPSGGGSRGGGGGRH